MGIRVSQAGTLAPAVECPVGPQGPTVEPFFDLPEKTGEVPVADHF